jgi:hypothetical protein
MENHKRITRPYTLINLKLIVDWLLFNVKCSVIQPYSYLKSLQTIRIQSSPNYNVQWGVNCMNFSNLSPRYTWGLVFSPPFSQLRKMCLVSFSYYFSVDVFVNRFCVVSLGVLFHEDYSRNESCAQHLSGLLICTDTTI